MEHLLLKAATTATDKGTFTAVISTASVDRDKDVIEPSAMVASLAKWAALGKLVPLAWNHTDEVVGHIDPATARIENGEVIADGFVDQSIPRGEEAWRLVKSGTLSFSFGFLFDPKAGAAKLPNGRYRVKELDIFEISVIPVGPANNETRILSYKAVDAPPTPLQARILNSMAGQAQEYIASDPDAEDAGEMAQILAMIEELRGEPATEDDDTMDQGKSITDLSPAPAQADAAVDEPGAQEPSEARSVDSLRKSALALALEVRSGGVSAQPPRVKQAPEPEPLPAPEMDPAQLRKRTRDLMLQVLSGVETT